MALQDWKAKFLSELSLSPNVARAARAVGVARSHAYAEKQVDAEFSQAWDDVLAEAVDDVESAVFTRARTESDTLAIFLLKSHRPETYNRPQKVEVSGVEHPRLVPNQGDPGHAESDDGSD
jgi:hypothetical protein